MTGGEGRSKSQWSEGRGFGVGRDRNEEISSRQEKIGEKKLQRTKE
jgi:hypothetical protein